MKRQEIMVCLDCMETYPLAAQGRVLILPGEGFTCALCIDARAVAMRKGQWRLRPNLTAYQKHKRLRSSP